MQGWPNFALMGMAGPQPAAMQSPDLLGGIAQQGPPWVSALGQLPGPQDQPPAAPTTITPQGVTPAPPPLVGRAEQQKLIEEIMQLIGGR